MKPLLQSPLPQRRELTGENANVRELLRKRDALETRAGTGRDSTERYGQSPGSAVTPGNVITPLDSNRTEPKAGPPIFPFNT